VQWCSANETCIINIMFLQALQSLAVNSEKQVGLNNRQQQAIADCECVLKRNRVLLLQIHELLLKTLLYNFYAK